MKVQKLAHFVLLEVVGLVSLTVLKINHISITITLKNLTSIILKCMICDKAPLIYCLPTASPLSPLFDPEDSESQEEENVDMFIQ